MIHLQTEKNMKAIKPRGEYFLSYEREKIEL